MQRGDQRSLIERRSGGEQPSRHDAHEQAHVGGLEVRRIERRLRLGGRGRRVPRVGGLVAAARLHISVNVFGSDGPVRRVGDDVNANRFTERSSRAVVAGCASRAAGIGRGGTKPYTSSGFRPTAAVVASATAASDVEGGLEHGVGVPGATGRMLGGQRSAARLVGTRAGRSGRPAIAAFRPSSRPLSTRSSSRACWTPSAEPAATSRPPEPAEIRVRRIGFGDQDRALVVDDARRRGGVAARRPSRDERAGRRGSRCRIAGLRTTWRSNGRPPMPPHWSRAAERLGCRRRPPARGPAAVSQTTSAGCAQLRVVRRDRVELVVVGSAELSGPLKGDSSLGGGECAGVGGAVRPPRASGANPQGEHDQQEQRRRTVGRSRQSCARGRGDVTGRQRYAREGARGHRVPTRAWPPEPRLRRSPPRPAARPRPRPAAPGFSDRVFNSDEAYLATQAQVLNHGGRLYVDTVDRKPPVVPYLYAAVFRLTGSDDLAPVRVVAVLAQVATALLLAARGPAPVRVAARRPRRRRAPTSSRPAAFPPPTPRPRTSRCSCSR